MHPCQLGYQHLEKQVLTHPARTNSHSQFSLVEA